MSKAALTNTCTLVSLSLKIQHENKGMKLHVVRRINVTFPAFYIPVVFIQYYYFVWHIRKNGNNKDAAFSVNHEFIPDSVISLSPLLTYTSPLLALVPLNCDCSEIVGLIAFSCLAGCLDIAMVSSLVFFHMFSVLFLMHKCVLFSCFWIFRMKSKSLFWFLAVDSKLFFR